MNIGVVKESAAGERRVGLTPASVKRLSSSHSVLVETGAGAGAGISDQDFREAGGKLTDREGALGADLVVGINAPEDLRRNGAVVLGLLRPFEQPEQMKSYAGSGVSALAFELVPRTTRAQSMDALSSQATVSGYQAVLEAALRCDRFFPMLTTAAGTIPPAKTLILGAGVAGLQAIATCRRLGAVVSAFDVRAAAAEQVRSLGASFVELDLAPQDAAASGGYAKELEADAEARVLAGLSGPVASADIVIATAAIPGRPAPLLISAEMVESMRPGSVIVDLAASTGGNCQLTKAGEVVERNGVTIVGFTDLAARKPFDASQMYSRNVESVVGILGAEGELDFADDILDQMTVTHMGQIRNARLNGSA